MRIAVVGAGSIGCLFTGHIARAHDVTLVCRRDQVEEIRAEGVLVDSAEGALRARPEAVDRVPEGPFDLVALAVKAHHLHEVCAELAASASAPRLVLCLQNGIGNEEILRAHFPPESIVRGLVYHAVTREGPGRVFWFGRGSTVIGRPFVGTRGEPDAEAEALAALLTESGFDTRASRDIRREVWKKLAVNAAINPLGAITGLTNGALVRSPLLVSLMRAAVRETEEVARAEEGHLIDMTDRTLEIALVTGRNRNSMLLDLEAGRGTEIEFLNGAIVRFAEQRGLAVPVNRTLHALVRGKEEALRMKSAEGPESVPGVTR